MRSADEWVCQGSRCRRKVEMGNGQQFLEKRGTFTRLCVRCASKRCEAPEPAAKPSRGREIFPIS